MNNVFKTNFFLIALVSFLFMPLIASADGMDAMGIGMIIFYGGILLGVFIISLVILFVVRSLRKRVDEKTTLSFGAILIFSFIITIVFAILGYSFFEFSDLGYISYFKCQIKPSSSCAYQAVKIGGDEKLCLYVDEKVKGYGPYNATFNRGDCYFAAARKKGDISLCEFVKGSSLSIKPQIDYCIRLIAQDKKNGALCNKINDLSMRNWCYSETSR